jgi:protein ImuB
VPERSIRFVGPLAPTSAWPLWPRPVRFLSPPEPLSGVVALLPDLPPRRFTWRGRAYRVTRADGPERIHGEWWRRRAEAEAVRDYFQVEDEDGRRFWLFRRGDGVDGRTGDLSWWMQGLMG